MYNYSPAKKPVAVQSVPILLHFSIVMYGGQVRLVAHIFTPFMSQ
jgi:hypothetical protein